MTTMRGGLWARLCTALLAAPLALGTPAGLDAQRAEARSCKCVDADGKEIERCTCFRAPELNFNAVIAGAAFQGTRPRLGVSVDVRQSARHDQLGARVTDVMDDGPADDAGLRPGDVITGVDGRSLFEPLAGDAERSFDLDLSIPVQRLLAISRELDEGDEVEVRYVRDGDTHTARVVAADLPEWGGDARFFGSNDHTRSFSFRFDDRVRDHVRERVRVAPRADVRIFRHDGSDDEARVFRRDGDAWTGTFAPLLEMSAMHRCPGTESRHLLDGSSACVAGLRLLEMKEGLSSYFGTATGVLVTEADTDSPLGLEGGDVVLRIGERTVDTPERMRRILGTLEPDEDVTFHVMREGREISVTGRLQR